MEELQETRKYAIKQFDKTLVLIASGGLVITIGFVEKILKITKDTDCLFLKITWILFTTTLLLNLLSHLTSAFAIDLEIRGKNKWSNIIDKSTFVLNILSIIAVILAIIFFIIFVSKNLNNG